jgi:hypothetical protein
MSSALRVATVMLRNHSMHVYVPFCLFVLQPSSVRQACLSGTGRRACQCEARPSPAGARLAARPGDAHSSGGAPTWAPRVNPGTACHVTETLARRDDPTAPPPPTSTTPPLPTSSASASRYGGAIDAPSARDRSSHVAVITPTDSWLPAAGGPSPAAEFLVRLAGSQPAAFFSHTNSAPASSHQPANSIFLSQQISTSHQPPASRTRPPSASRNSHLCSRLRAPQPQCLVSLKFQKFYKILRHIKSLDVCIEH